MEKLLFVAIDVDDKKYHGYAVTADLEEGFEFHSKPNAAALIKRLEKFTESGFKIKICYESTYIGFSLCRDLRLKGYDCEVIATSVIPEISSKRVKTDRVDAKKLAIYYSKGMLTPVYVPTLDDESDRMLIRTRAFVRDQLTSTRKLILSTCRKYGWNYKDDSGSDQPKYWSREHKYWLMEKLKTANGSAKINLNLLICNTDMLEERLDDFNDQIEALAKSEKYKTRVQALTCFRGIDFYSALALVCEIGDIRRFAHPKNLVSYAGMDICEYSSGGKERKFQITKMGNRHIRTVLVESNQGFALTPQVSQHLKRRRENCDQKHIEIANRCMMRLHKKATKLKFKNKPNNKIKVACAREMVGFVWESLMKVA
jgi:transposase